MSVITIDLAGGGALDPDQVYVQYVCNTGPGGQHDPEMPPDDRVRPSHAALHGKVFRLDDPLTPIPPIDYGCRCAIRYVAKPESVAAGILKVTALEAPTTRAAAYVDWMDENADGWRAILPTIRDVAPVDRMGAAYDAAVELGIANPRDVARMVVEAIAARAVTEAK